VKRSIRKTIIGQLRVTVIVRDLRHLFSGATDDIGGIGVPRELEHAVSVRLMSTPGTIRKRFRFRHVTSCGFGSKALAGLPKSEPGRVLPIGSVSLFRRV
jgi:hypothetical protein